MSEFKPGTIEWHDLTVDDAESVRDFYAAVVGWEPQAVSMGDYDDFSMLMPGTEQPTAGVCHARGANADLPAQWLMYVRVLSVPDSAARCSALGGKVLTGPTAMGDSEFCVIEDPAGAVLALYGQSCVAAC